ILVQNLPLGGDSLLLSLGHSVDYALVMKWRASSSPLTLTGTSITLVLTCPPVLVLQVISMYDPVLDSIASWYAETSVCWLLPSTKVSVKGFSTFDHSSADL